MSRLTRFVAPLLACFALLFFAAPARAAFISACSDDGSGNIHCDFDFNGDTSGTIDPLLDGYGVFPNWLVGYSFLMNPGFSYSSGTANVNSVAVFHSGYAQLFSSADPTFGFWSSAALALAPIDATSLALGQIVGSPFFPGASSSGGIGIVSASGTVWPMTGIAWYDGTSGFGGNGDSITVAGAVAGPAPIPEPATLTLFGLSAAGAGLRRWRSRAKRT